MIHQAHLLEELRDIVRCNVSDECCQLRALVIIDMVGKNAETASDGAVSFAQGAEDLDQASISSYVDLDRGPDTCDTPFSVDSTNFNFQTERCKADDVNAVQIDMDICNSSSKQEPPKTRRAAGPKLKGSVLLSFDDALDENCQRLQRRRRRASLTVLSASDMNTMRAANGVGEMGTALQKAGGDDDAVVKKQRIDELEQIHIIDSAIEPEEVSVSPIKQCFPTAQYDMHVSMPRPDDGIAAEVSEDMRAEVELDSTVPEPPTALSICSQARKSQTKPSRSRRKSISAKKHAKLKKTVLDSVLESVECDVSRDDSAENDPEDPISDHLVCDAAEDSECPNEIYLGEEEAAVCGHAAPEDMCEDGYGGSNVPSVEIEDPSTAPIEEVCAQPAPSRRVLYNPATSGLSGAWEEDSDFAMDDCTSSGHIDVTPVTPEKEPEEVEPVSVEEVLSIKAPIALSFMPFSSLPMIKALDCLAPELSPETESRQSIIQSNAGLVLVSVLAYLIETADICSDNDFDKLGRDFYDIFNNMTKCNISTKLDDAPQLQYNNKRVRFTTLGTKSDNCVSPPNDRRPETLSAVDGICRELSGFIGSVDACGSSFDRIDAIGLRDTLCEILQLLSSSAEECEAVLKLMKKDFPQEISDQMFSSENNRNVMNSSSVIHAELFGRNSGSDNCVVWVWNSQQDEGSDIIFQLQYRIASEFRHQVAWMASAAIRSRLRWLFDDVPPCYSKPSVTGSIKYEDSRSGLFSLLTRTEPAAGAVGEKPRLKLTISGSNPTSSHSKRRNEVIYDVPLSYLMTCALRQMYDGIVFAYQDDSDIATDVTVLLGNRESCGYKSLFQQRAESGLNSDCIVGRIECAQLLLAAEAGRRFMANIISLPLVFAVGEEGGVWSVLEEFGSLLARMGQREDSHFALLSSMRLLEQLVSEPFLDNETLYQAKGILTKKLVVDKGLKSGSGVSLEHSTRFGYSDPVKYVKDSMAYCPYIHCFPDVSVAETSING